MIILVITKYIITTSFLLFSNHIKYDVFLKAVKIDLLNYQMRINTNNLSILLGIFISRNTFRPEFNVNFLIIT